MRQPFTAPWFGLTVLLTASGCAHGYSPPRTDEPHARVKVRRSYGEEPAPFLSELVEVNGHEVHAGRGIPVGTASDVELRVHPGATTVRIVGEFYRTETRMVRESYTEYENRYHQREQHNCGGPGSIMCTSEGVGQRPVTKYREVAREVDVPVANCDRDLQFEPEAGGAYLLEYHFAAAEQCAVRCFQRSPADDGTFRMTPCGGAAGQKQ